MSSRQLSRRAFVAGITATAAAALPLSACGGRSQLSITRSVGDQCAVKPCADAGIWRGERPQRIGYIDSQIRLLSADERHVCASGARPDNLYLTRRTGGPVQRVVMPPEGVPMLPTLARGSIFAANSQRRGNLLDLYRYPLTEVDGVLALPANHLVAEVLAADFHLRQGFPIKDTLIRQIDDHVSTVVVARCPSDTAGAHSYIALTDTCGKGVRLVDCGAQTCGEIQWFGGRAGWCVIARGPCADAEGVLEAYELATDRRLRFTLPAQRLIADVGADGPEVFLLTRDLAGSNYTSEHIDLRAGTSEPHRGPFNCPSCTLQQVLVTQNYLVWIRDREIWLEDRNSGAFELVADADVGPWFSGATYLVIADEAGLVWVHGEAAARASATIYTLPFSRAC